ncbi:hypothetical protein [Protofrankia symbiont of Coriaria ruscifolia]|uniref:hypothetical protein n=1 Tax=Protofrankia symbiont of Coriaria ruscifolia TaxID=1306542 RepID=UPI001A95139E|nr:hypothetical protein [Protofrankia symbiont of Coriaria ruscifolia]
MTKHTVTYGADFLAAAEATYPNGRSMSYSGPTFHEFMALPVRTARFAFANNWDNLPSTTGGAARLLILEPNGAFGPIVFYAVLVARPTGPVVEIAGFEEDRAYWDTFVDPDG